MAGTSGAVLAGLLAIAGALNLAAPASAAPIACKFDAAQERPTLKVALKKLVITRMSVDGGAIEVADNSATPVPCAGDTPTTTNTDQINFKARDGQDQTVLVEDPAAFAPGVEDEFFGADEIEWKLRLGRGKDELTFLAGNAADDITAGTGGVNMNVAGLVLADDVDYTLKKVERLDFRGGGGDDEISAAGGDGTGEVWRRGVSFSDTSNNQEILIGGDGDDHLAGGQGNDELSGGKGDDLLIGAPDDDSLSGGGGHDELSGSADGDLIDGGAGVDTALYDGLSNGSPVVVDIGVGGDNDGGPDDGPVGDRDEVTDSVENLVGEDEIDFFTGDPDGNVLVGGLGVDSLVGLGGDDLLRAKDGVADNKIDCGAGAGDAATFDPGLDPPRESC